MDNLYTLINKYGQPDALVDHWDKNSKQFAAWEFDEIFLISNEGVPYLNGKKSNLPPLQILQNTVDRWKQDLNEISVIGYISYDLKNILYPHISFNQHNSGYPLLWFGKPKKVLHYYHDSKKKTLPTECLTIKKDIPLPAEYKISLSKIKEYLEEGSSYQINYTQPKEYKLKLNSFDTYLNMREYIEPHYGVYLNTGKIQILSFSPERFFKKTGENIYSFPMKGTRPRSSNLKQDSHLLYELSKSKKDKAEHLMIVDLMRNDLGKICEFGSVKVEDLYSISSFQTVHQMISNIHGKLSANIGEVDIIKALFPGGSITGAPKERAMEIIDSLEQYQRNIYTGSMGYITKDGDMDFNIAIRTMTVKNKKAIYPVGGGIVWDSNPLEEWQEAQLKSKILSPFKIDDSKKTITNIQSI